MLAYPLLSEDYQLVQFYIFLFSCLSHYVLIFKFTVYTAHWLHPKCKLFGQKWSNMLDFYIYYVLVEDVFNMKEFCVLLTLRRNILSLWENVSTLELDFFRLHQLFKQRYYQFWSERRASFCSLIEEVTNAADTWKSGFFDFRWENTAIKNNKKPLEVW